MTQVTGISASAIYFPAATRQAEQAAGDAHAPQPAERFSAPPTGRAATFSTPPGFSLTPGDFAQAFSQVAMKTGGSLFQAASIAYGRAMLLGTSWLSLQA